MSSHRSKGREATSSVSSRKKSKHHKAARETSTESDATVTPRLTVPIISVTASSEASSSSPEPYDSSGSDTEKDSKGKGKGKMALRSSNSKHASESSTSSKKTKSDGWKEVTEPEERRRIQNRIAQRKFSMYPTSSFRGGVIEKVANPNPSGEKAKESRERAERDARNQAHAIGAYHIPEAEELPDEGELSRFPWGWPKGMVCNGERYASVTHHGGASGNPFHKCKALCAWQPV